MVVLNNENIEFKNSLMYRKVLKLKHKMDCMSQRCLKLEILYEPIMHYSLIMILLLFSHHNIFVIIYNHQCSAQPQTEMTGVITLQWYCLGRYSGIDKCQNKLIDCVCSTVSTVVRNLVHLFYVRHYMYVTGWSVIIL